MDEIQALMKRLLKNPMTTHEFFFEHRHANAPAEFHSTLLSDWYSNDPRVAQSVFRGGAKSTIGEEACALTALFSLAKNIIIIGSSEARAKERLAAIKYELEYNEWINDIFDDVSGPTWGETHIILKNLTSIRALGWNQSMRGMKHLTWRPDLCWIDDPEDEENTKDEDAREKVINRLLSVIIPAVDAPNARIRVTGSILSSESLIPRLLRSSEWIVRNYPVKYVNAKGEWKSSWPSRRSMTWINNLENDYRALGKYDIFEREYMCIASVPTTQKFYEKDFVFRDYSHTYEPVYVIYDPARTTKETSAHTGKVVISWVSNKLIVWESSGNFWSPSETFDDIVETNKKYSPIFIAIERDGLEEYILQPLRHRQRATGSILPILPLRAPRGKLTFIRGLQPFFAAHEIVLVPDRESHATLIDQLLNFPDGRKDVPNALAYALQVQLGEPVFDNFMPSAHIEPTLEPIRGYPLVLAVHSDNSYTSAVLFQHVRGSVHVLADWIAEGPPAATLGDITAYAALTAPRIPVKVVVPAQHFNHYDTIGLRAAAAKVPVALHRGAEAATGLAEARRRLGATSHGVPALRVSSVASWTLRALSGGYVQELRPDCALRGSPQATVYAVLMGGFLSALAVSRLEEPVDFAHKIAYTPGGAPYLSARG